MLSTITIKGFDNSHLIIMHTCTKPDPDALRDMHKSPVTFIFIFLGLEDFKIIEKFIKVFELKKE